MYSLAIFYILLAGIFNGLFAAPSRITANLSFNMIWFFYSIFGLLVVPWVLLALFFPGSVHYFHHLVLGDILIMIFSGLVFGVGQIFFFNSISRIGLAQSFTINIGVSIVVGTLFVILFKGFLLTKKGMITLALIILILISLVLYQQTDRKRKIIDAEQGFGGMLAVLAGLASGLQNISFVLVAFHFKSFLTENAYWYWPPFLSFAAIPLLIYFCKGILKNDRNICLYRACSLKNLSLTFLMGLLFSGSLALYSLGMHNLSSLEQIIGWPIFMSSIILTSQICGLFYDKVSLKNHFNLYRTLSILILCITIFLIGFNQ